MTGIQATRNSLVSKILTLFFQEHMKYPAVSWKLGRQELRLHAQPNTRAVIPNPNNNPRKANMHLMMTTMKT